MVDESIQREALALLARGLVPHDVAARVPLASIDGAPRLLAWLCALRSCRANGNKSTFLGARYCLVRAPQIGALHEWAPLRREAEAELDAAEKIETLDSRTMDRMLTDRHEGRTDE